MIIVLIHAFALALTSLKVPIDAYYVRIAGSDQAWELVTGKDSTSEMFLQVS